MGVHVVVLSGFQLSVCVHVMCSCVVCLKMHVAERVLGPFSNKRFCCCSAAALADQLLMLLLPQLRTKSEVMLFHCALQ